MNESRGSRDIILSRIRGGETLPTAVTAQVSYAAIARTYERQGQLSFEQRIHLFEERLIEYDARVHRVTPSTLPSVVSAAVRERGAKRMAISSGVPAGWLPADLEFTEASHLTNLELNEYDGVLSGCTVAIALTGTIVLQNAAAQGPRKLSLIPEYHLCIVLADQIVETVSEAFDRLALSSTLPTTFISGPSATADIEMTRIKGVHGPRFLEILIVD